MASSASEAIKLDRVMPVEDVFIDEQWKMQNPIPKQNQVGFTQK